MTSDELKFPYRVRQLLDAGAAELDQGIANRLEKIRAAALERQRVAVAELSLAGIGRSATESVSQHARGVAAAIALVIGAVGAYYWHGGRGAAEEINADAEIDSALLADEVPFSAYLDQGFLEWLYHVSKQQQASAESPPQ